jgi:tetratricopeptide (TPR) repeat protein
MSTNSAHNRCLIASGDVPVPSERWNRLEQVFAEALALPIAARSAYLEHACGGDASLRNEIDGLLRSHDSSGVLDIAPHSSSVVVPQPSLAPGTCLGPWRIDKLIGRGGMGEVYAAVRADAAFEQQAALKLLRYEAVGQLERFHAERRILASLEHPGIARLLDGGMAPDGRPYTVMEYVEGQSLTAYCNEHHATLHERLALFTQVCDAVAFAHRNLIIHRDLKPDNILVDAEGRVKLLDFGIAKLLDAAAAPLAADSTIAPFTPDYAAPEQLSGESVTTATDIYALGVLLFELLVGERPLRMHGRLSAQVLRLLLDRDAPLPSRIAQNKSDAPVPARLLTGDLDAIVAKCLRKEATHRYETVNALRLDVGRHLRNEPVLAREGARLYVFGRLLRRYRWAVAGIAALIVTLAAGLAGTIWQAQRAETQARTSTAVQGFLTDLFRTNTSSQDDPVKARQTTARELLDLGAKKIDTSMADAPAAKLSVLHLLGELYDDLALDEESVRLRSEAVALTRSLYGTESIETAAALIELAGPMHYTPAVVEERQKVLGEAISILDRKRDFTSDTRGLLLLKLTEHYYSLDAPKSLGFAQQAVHVFEAKPPSGHLAEALYTRGLSEHNNGLEREAVVSLHRAIEISRAVEGFPNPRLPRYYAYLGQYEYRLQDIAGAEASTRLALQMAIAINGEDHVDTLQIEMRLGRILFDSGSTREGLALLQTAKQRALKIRGADDPIHTPLTLMEHGSAQVRMGLLEEGSLDLDAAVANRRKNQVGTTYLATALEVAASNLVESGRTDKALAYLDEASAIEMKSGIAPHTSRANFNTNVRIRVALAETHAETARSLLSELFVDPDESLGISFTAIEMWLLTAEIDLASGSGVSAAALVQRVRSKIEKSGLGASLPFYALRADLVEGKAALQQHAPTVALPLLQRTLAMREQLLAPSSLRIAEAQIALAECQLALGREPEARSLADRATAIHAQHPQIGEQYRAPLRQLQDHLAGAATK